MYKDISFCYVIIITKHLCFGIIYMCLYMSFKLIQIKYKTQTILTKQKKLFFFNHNLNHGFTKHKTAFFLPQCQPQFFNQTQKTTFFKTKTSTTVLTKHQLFSKSTSQKVLFIKLLFSNHNHKSYHNTKHALNLITMSLKCEMMSFQPKL